MLLRYHIFLPPVKAFTDEKSSLFGRNMSFWPEILAVLAGIPDPGIYSSNRITPGEGLFWREKNLVMFFNLLLFKTEFEPEKCLKSGQIRST